MKKARVRSYTTRRRPSGLGWGYMGPVVRVGVRILMALLPLVPVLAVAIVFLLPETPHLRVSYTYTGAAEHPSYRTCRYLGIHGTVNVIGEDCPIVQLMGKVSMSKAFDAPVTNQRHWRPQVELNEKREIWERSYRWRLS